MKKRLILLLLACFSVVANSQNKNDEAQKKLQIAIEFMDNGHPDEAITLLNDAKKLDPTNSVYDYEIGYANYVKGDYKKAIAIFKKLAKSKYAYDGVYQMLGNSYDMNGSSKKALETYSQGLKLFPKSGRLYLETGNVYWQQSKYDQAVTAYQKGIEVEPRFSSNYFRSGLLYLNSTEKVWGLISGEMLRILEPESKRSREIGALMFKTYQSNINFTSDTTMSVSFSQSQRLSSDKDGSIKLPFGITVYEPLLMLSAIGKKEITLSTLTQIREQFINLYFEKGYDKKYPSALFSYHKQLIDSGHFETFNQWLYSDANKEEFEKWKETNSTKWDAFVDWFEANPINITDENRLRLEE